MLSKKGRTIVASGDKNGVVNIWDYSTNRLMKSLEEHQKEVRSVNFSPDGKYLATGGFDETINIFDCTKNFELIGSINSHTGGVVSVKWHPKVPMLVSTSADKSARVWVPQLE